MMSSFVTMNYINDMTAQLV